MATLAPTGTAVVDMTDIGKAYMNGGRPMWVLRGVSLRVDPGEFVAIMGPSGSGKSTMLNIVGALDLPDHGAYRLDGHDVGGLNEAELARLRNETIGFVFQNFSLIGRMSTLANVELPLLYRGVGRRERRQRALSALRAVGLVNRAHHMPNELSGGQKQRAAIARALAGDPALLLADEPTGALDSTNTEMIMELFAEANAAGSTIVMITHEDDVAAYSTRIVRLRDGMVVSDAPNLERTTVTERAS